MRAKYASELHIWAYASRELLIILRDTACSTHAQNTSKAETMAETFPCR